MNRKACGFIDHHQIVVAVNDAALDSLGPTIGNCPNVIARGNRNRRYSNNVTRFQFMFGLGSPLVNTNFTRPDSFVDARLGHAAQNSHQVII
jgi:hypothetical protein